MAWDELRHTRLRVLQNNKALKLVLHIDKIIDSLRVLQNNKALKPREI